MKMYIAVLNEVPDHMVPVVVAHAVLGAHLDFSRSFIAETPGYELYVRWLEQSFKKCVVSVNRREFEKIVDNVFPLYLGHENKTLNGGKCCAVTVVDDDIPNVLKFAKLWKPKEILS